MDRIFPKNSQILSPRVIVRPYPSWKYRLAAILALCFVLLSVSWGMFEAGKQSGNNLLEEFTEEKIYGDSPYDPAVCRQTKRQQLCSDMGELIHQVQMHHTANDNLLKQIKALTYENDQLKEKMLFFEHLMSGSTKNGISIYQFNLKETEIPGKFRYALTLIQGGKRPNDFKGKVRLLVTLLQNDKTKTVPLVNQESKLDFPISFKFLYRLEDSFKVPDGMTIKNLQVQVYENSDGKVLLTQTTQPTL